MFLAQICSLWNSSPGLNQSSRSNLCLSVCSLHVIVDYAQTVRVLVFFHEEDCTKKNLRGPQSCIIGLKVAATAFKPPYLVLTSYYTHLQRWKVKWINYKKIPQGKMLKGQGFQNLRFGSEMVENHHTWFLGLCNSLLTGLGQDQNQYPAVHTEGVSRGRVRGCGSWR